MEAKSSRAVLVTPEKGDGLALNTTQNSDDDPSEKAIALINEEETKDQEAAGAAGAMVEYERKRSIWVCAGTSPTLSTRTSRLA